MAIRVLLADDHTLVRQGLRVLLESKPRFTVVGEADDGREALQLVEKLHPDVVVMDIGMPGMNGLEATAQITGQESDTKVVILSMYTDEIYVHQSLRVGASAYVLKRAVYNELQLAIEAAHRGEKYLSPGISNAIVDTYLRAAPVDDRQRTYELLTSRQREVLQLIAEGRTRQEISEILCISPKTVARHRENLMAKLGFQDEVELVKFALRIGLFTDSTGQ
ncbi:MAG: response regulator transcription factor [Anaerolineae bacterium]|nr:response regulator transcription factor [Anaerolineae bacterium]